MSRCVSILAAALVLSVGGSAYGQACPDGTWCEFNGHWYQRTPLATWDDARAAAAALGGYLVSVNTEPEQNFLGEKFPRPTTGDPNHWLGYYQDKNDAGYSEPGGG